MGLLRVRLQRALIMVVLVLLAFFSAGGSRAEASGYEQLFEHHGSIILVVDAQTGQIKYANRAAVDFYGYPKEMLFSMNVDDINILTPEDTLRERRAAAREQRNYFVFSHRLASGETRYVEVYSYPFWEGSEVLLCSIIHDITERVQREKALAFRNYLFFGLLVVMILAQLAVIIMLRKSSRLARLNYNKYKSLFDHMQEGFAVHEIICDEDGKPVDYRFIDVNHSFEELTGLMREKIVGKTVKEVLPNTEPYWIEKYGEVALTGKAISFEDYSVEFDKYFAVTAYSPKRGMFAVMFNDITQRKKLERRLHDEKERFRTTLMSVGDGVIATDKEGKVEFLNLVAQQMTGWTEAAALGKNIRDVFHIYSEVNWEVCENPVQKVLESGKTVGLANHTALLSRDGVVRSIADSAAPIVSADGGVRGVVLVFRDITEEKKRLDEIEYLSRHDSLTGLYNRRFFEDTLAKLDVPENLPLTILVSDINGFKLINDAFGHLTGDKLLKMAADAVRRGCYPHRNVIRWGGDEFIVILPKTCANETLNVMQRVREEFAKVKIKSLQLSLSLGSETKIYPGQDIMEILKTAEANMYRDKLQDGQSMIGKAINIIHGTLIAKSPREAQHSKRVADISKKIAIALGLPEAQVSEIETAGLVHDIGKIAIPENILDKPGELTDQEWQEIRRHPEVGYRILSSSNDMAEIAMYVLSHHERYDGRGYPTGLKGENIPLQARILAVADSFDAMTSARSYRAALPVEYAIEELKKNAGTQFDPEIVHCFIEMVDVVNSQSSIPRRSQLQ